MYNKKSPKRQSNLFEADVRAKKRLEYKFITKIMVTEDTPKEYCTKNNIIITVEKKRKEFSGVGDCFYYQISDRGMVLKPFTAQGVKNYINNPHDDESKNIPVEDPKNSDTK